MGLGSRYPPNACFAGLLVTVPPPTGDDAVRLWDLTLEFARFPGVFELKRPKTVDDLRMIARVFEPYLRARDWQTIENPAP